MTNRQHNGSLLATTYRWRWLSLSLMVAYWLPLFVHCHTVAVSFREGRKKEQRMHVRFSALATELVSALGSVSTVALPSAQAQRLYHGSHISGYHHGLTIGQYSIVKVQRF